MAKTVRDTEILLREARQNAGLSLREAAKRLGITHSFLSALELGHKPLRPERRAEIALAYGLVASTKLTQPLPSDKEKFLDWLRSQIRWWDSRFVLPTIPAVTATVPELYVSPSFVNEEGQYIDSDKVLAQFLNDSSNQALLVGGRIGSGKSFFLRELTLETETILKAAGSTKRYVPLLVSLGEFQMLSGSLLLSLVAYYRKLGYEGSPAELESYLRQCLERGSAMFLFDGLDEKLDPSERSAMFAGLERAFEDHVRRTGSKMIITGREEVFAERARRNDAFHYLVLRRWQAQQVFEASVKWGWNDAAQAQNFKLILRANDTLFLLGRTPLIFHLLTTLYSSRGMLPFQDLAGLFDACCRTLENSWAFARKTLPTDLGGQAGNDLPAGYRWLKWRHFLIFLMKRELARADGSASVPRFTFSADEVQAAWDAFLSNRGIPRQSVEYSQLEGMVLSHNAIGPMFHHFELDHAGELRSRYSFLDDSFGRYYLALALIDEPEELEARLLRFVRNEHWSPVLALAVQELGRSERAAEQELAERLIDTLLRCDDARRLDHKHGIGKFGLLTAMRGMGSYTVEGSWKTTVQPCFEVLDTDEELTCRLAWKAIGEQSAAPLVRRYIHEMVEAAFDPVRGKSISEYRRQRILAMMAYSGQNFELVVSKYIADLQSFVEKGGEGHSERRLALRRFFWRLPHIGRLFVLENLSSSDDRHNELVRSLSAAAFEVASYLTSKLEQELASGKFVGYQCWHIFSTIISSQRKLHYFNDLKKTLRALLVCVERYFDPLCKAYPHRVQLLQFMKVAAFHADMIEPALVKRTMATITKHAAVFSSAEQYELEVVLQLFRDGRRPAAGSVDYRLLYEEVYKRPVAQLLREWVDTVRQRPADLVAFGTAICGIGEFYQQLSDSDGSYAQSAVIESLLRCFVSENSIPAQQELEEDRCFTKPFTDYCFPIYDHLFNALTELARGLPLKIF
jgi:transcriptional regulator with XRE-family HTH domain